MGWSVGQSPLNLPCSLSAPLRCCELHSARTCRVCPFAHLPCPTQLSQYDAAIDLLAAGSLVKVAERLAELVQARGNDPTWHAAPLLSQRFRDSVPSCRACDDLNRLLAERRVPKGGREPRPSPYLGAVAHKTCTHLLENICQGS